MNRTDINIYVLCYKSISHDIPNNSLYIPLQCGADIVSDSIYEMRDNTYDNISWMNPLCAELTGTYWIWKNKSKLLKYVGQCQYRRQIEFQENEDFDHIFSEYDSILPIPYRLGTSLYDQYRYFHNIKDLDMLIDIVKYLYPDFYDTFYKTLSDSILYYSSGMILRRNDFNEYCEILFGILRMFFIKNKINFVDDMRMYVANNIHNYGYNMPESDITYQMLIGGFFAERIFSAYVLWKFKNPYMVNYSFKNLF